MKRTSDRHQGIVTIASIVLLGTIATIAATVQAGYSELWGRAGELWDPRGRLPDYSYAGYHAGEKDIPHIPVVNNVKDFGALGDGATDDTAAFKAALAATTDGTLLVPRGRYILSDILELNNSNTVLRGEGTGRDGTVLLFTRHLTDITGRGTAPWRYGAGGLVWVGRGQAWKGKALTTLAAEAKRGDLEITVADPLGLSAGQYVVLSLKDASDHSLMFHLHNDQADASDWDTVGKGDLKWPVRIESIAGQTLKLVQPLRFDIRAQWKPRLFAYNPVTEVGIENLRIEFPDRMYRGHHQERGFNGLAFYGALNCWANDVIIKNAENGLMFGAGAKQCETRRLTMIGATEAISTPGPDEGLHAHHGISFVGATDCMAVRFEAIDPTCHDITVSHKANGNVVRQATGFDLCLDHHREAPFENLFCDIQAGRGSRLYASSGNIGTGPHSGARETFWNIRSAAWDVPGYPGRLTSWGRWTTKAWDHIQINVIPCQNDRRSKDRQWQEVVDRLEPADLYLSQLSRRLGKPVAPPAVTFRPTILPQKARYQGGVWVTLLSPQAGATIRYTLDGSMPTESSRLYAKPFLLKDNGTLKARAWIDGRQASQVATEAYEIDADRERPVIKSVSAVGDPGKVRVVFSERLDRQVAGNASLYALTGGVQIRRARLEPDVKSVTLWTTPMRPGTTYALTVRNVTDTWANPIAPETAVTFTYAASEPRLIAHWSFDDPDDAAVADLSPAGYQAELHGAAIVEEGKDGFAVRFDGDDDYVSLPSELLKDVADFTFAAWVFLEGANTGSHIFDFNNGLCGPGRGAYMYLGPTSRHGAQMRITLGGIVHDEGVRTGRHLPIRQWVHVAAVLQGDVAKVYANGKLLATDRAAVNPRDLEATALWLGRNIYAGSPPFKGLIDDVRLYNYALDKTELGRLAGLVDLAEPPK